MLAIRRILLGLVVCFLSTGCRPTTHEQLGWRAEDFFDDPRVIALCEAILADDLPAMQKAIDARADINAIGKHGMTPLLWAFPDHKPDRFRWLLERGANPNVCITKNLSKGLPLVDRGMSVTHLAIDAMWPDYYRWVLDHGGDPNLLCEGQREPLLHVAFQALVPNKKERIEALLDAGADIDAKGSGGGTVAMAAASLAYFDVALMLVDRGARIDVYREGGNQQLAHCVIKNESKLERYSEANRQAYDELVDRLEKRGVDFDKARADIARWKSWVGEPAEIRRRREQEVAERKAREAAEEKRPKLAE